MFTKPARRRPASGFGWRRPVRQYAHNEINLLYYNYLIDVPPPYPYRALHAGNFVNFTYQDFFARYKRMRGFSVLHSWGWDCHGLPAELYIEKNLDVTADKVGVTKFRVLCKENLLISIDNIRSNQAIPLGMSIDWDKQYSGGK